MYSCCSLLKILKHTYVSPVACRPCVCAFRSKLPSVRIFYYSKSHHHLMLPPTPNCNRQPCINAWPSHQSLVGNSGIFIKSNHIEMLCRLSQPKILQISICFLFFLSLHPPIHFFHSYIVFYVHTFMTWHGVIVLLDYVSGRDSIPCRHYLCNGFLLSPLSVAGYLPKSYVFFSFRI